jgi:pSer/pThr/pTyr-binding forkhead associated (FHA) protein
MDVHLKVLVGSNAGATVKVVGPRFYVGRSAECHLRPRSDAVGRLHCVVAVYDDCVTVCDLHSRNGTYVNGQRIAHETPLNSGDRLKIGPLEFEIVIRNDNSTTSRHAGTARISADETDPAESPRPPSDHAGDAQEPEGAHPDENQPQRVNTDEAAAEVLRRLRRFRRA